MTIKLEVGKSYKAKNGETYTITSIYNKDKIYPFRAIGRTGVTHSFTVDGKFLYHDTSNLDLIEEFTENTNNTQHKEIYTKEQINSLVESIHKANVEAGWYINLQYSKKLEELKKEFSEEKAKEILNKLDIKESHSYNVGEKLALIHSEVSEAMEGHRKNLQDDKLPHRSMFEVELADTVIRIFDLAGAEGLDLGGAIEEKLAYNTKREDHKLENRIKDGGKKY